MNVTSLLPQTNRLPALDVLRGIAVLGILIMNMQSFSMISAAYLNPTAFGDLTGINRTVWILSHILADQKFISIFSMLFGAGIVLFSESIEDKGYRPARFYYRRLFWIFTIGLIHAYIFWQGDVLVPYAICGALAFLFRRISPWTLIALGAIIFTIPVFNYWIFGNSISMWPPEAVRGIQHTWAPSQIAIDAEIASLQGGISDQLLWRIPETFKMETFIFLILLGWRILAMMMIGMALYRLEFVTGTLSKKTYLISALITFILGFGLIIHGLKLNFDNGWTMEYSMFFGSLWNYIGSAFVAIGYISVLMLILKNIKFGVMANVGRLAFTNYLLTTILCGFIFYGHGLGKFGTVDRWEQAIYIVVIWCFLIAFSVIWSRKFYYGPVEWLWRYLTYGNKPAFRK